MPAPQTEVLVFVEGLEIARHLLGPGAHTFGRSEACNIRIEAAHVSRQHARLTVGADGSLLLEDLGSANGTFLDGQQINAPTPVAPNKSIEIGAAILLVQQTVARADGAADMPPELTQAIRYEPGAEIKRGAMGAILSARQPAIRREVAMKVPLRDISTRDRMRFIEEAQITGQLEHPNIVPVHDLTLNEHGEPYYTMKLVKGSSLHDILKLLAQGDAAAIAKYPLAALLTIFQKICDAVAFAHAQGVIHRDLKPGNIMVGDYGEVFVMDWGLAKIIGGRCSVAAPSSDMEVGADRAAPSIIASAREDQRDLFGTDPDTLMGTPEYMSPEQASSEGATLDERSDIFSLGAILYELVTLLRPFPGETQEEILAKVSSGHFVLPNARLRGPNAPRPRHLPGAAIPDSLEAVISKALAHDREQRYQSVAEFQADLTAYQNGFATSAEQAGLGKHFLLFVKRHKAISLAFIVSLLAFAGSIGTVSEFRQAREHARTAERLQKLVDQQTRLAQDFQNKFSEIGRELEDSKNVHTADIQKLVNELGAIAKERDLKSQEIERLRKPIATPRPKLPLFRAPALMTTPRILMIGDNMSVNEFGEAMERYLKNRFEPKNVALYASCGSSPEHWLRNGPLYITKCGYREFTPKHGEIVHNFLEGRLPEPTRTPKLEEVLPEFQPTTVIVQLGMNWFDAIKARKVRDDERYRTILDQFVDAIHSQPGSDPQIIWITPPDASRFSPEVKGTVQTLIKEASDRKKFQTIDSNKMTTYVPGKSGGDGIHFYAEEANQWAEKVIQKLDSMIR